MRAVVYRGVNDLRVETVPVPRIQSDELRRRRRSQLQERAARASLQMVFPMVGCIFPTIWIILLGPALMTVIASFIR